MSFNLIKYIGDAAKRVFTTEDLKNIGATEEDLKSLSGNSVLTFAKNAVHELESGLAHFIASHPTLSAEFHVLADDEAADEDLANVTNPVTEGAGPGDSSPAGTTPTDGTSLPTAEPETDAETVGENVAAPVETPATTAVAADQPDTGTN